MDEVLAAIDAALAEKGLSDAAASKLAVGNYSLIKNMRLARAKNPEDRRYNYFALARLAEVLDLECYFGPRRPDEPVQAASQTEFALVPLHRASLAAGAGSENESERVIAHLAFRKDWLRQLHVSPANAVIARTAGDSMAPTIHDQDMLLVDRARAQPPIKVRDPQDKRPAPIYALLDDGAARVKRIELASPGNLALLSDNPSYPPEFRPTRSVSIIGRVVWWGHTNRE
ncbi:S24 family peptidase [Frigidibacter oleivorans]|uniref:S24 family peptidase n=1 Tax=Frigidibacter oleivorans TaxID=2487129 RepID=UPI000F8D1654|nr:S24 family peptidase [Frigidibacter oleivorans]